MKSKLQSAIWISLMLTAAGGSCLGQTTILDPLHVFCYGASTCNDNGNNAPTTTNPPQFGFSISPPLQSGDYLIEVLVPNNDQTAGMTFSIGGTSGSLNGNNPISATTTAISGEWTSGDLDTFLGISASPTNPIDAYLGCTQNPTSSSCGDVGTGDPTAMGYSVYQADLGTLELVGPSGPFTAGPELTIGGSPLPQYSFIVGFLNTGTTASPDWVATANSGALFVDGPFTPTVPEPSSWLLLGTLVAGVGGLLWRKRTA